MGNKWNHKSAKKIIECGPTGKRFYKNEVTAKEASERLSEKHKLDFRIYFCNYCGGFHLTRQKKGR